MEITKEQIQKEYNDKVAIFGQRVYHFLVPALELLGMAQGLMSLNQHMARLRAKEAECPSKTSPAPNVLDMKL